MSAKMSIKELKRQFSPDRNPLLEPVTIATRRRHVRSAKARELVDPLTGEISAVASIHTVEEKDDEEFVKIFAAGVAASYSLSKTGQRVFQAVLTEYQSTKMTGGFADSVYLPWFNGGLDGRAVGMSERTFNRGLAELIECKFLAPRSPDAYWVNPALFFKGNRVAFIREYRRKVRGDDEIERERLERLGQQRLCD